MSTLTIAQETIVCYVFDGLLGDESNVPNGYRAQCGIEIPYWDGQIDTPWRATTQ